MADPTNMTDWAPGQPPPWLGAYGPSPDPIGGTPVPQLPTQQLAQGAPTLGSPQAIPEPIGGTPTPQMPTNPNALTLAQQAPTAATPMANQMPAQAPPEVAAPAAPAFAPPWLPPQPQASSASIQPPSVDAVSGGATPPAPGAETPGDTFVRVAQDANAPLADRQKAWQQLTPDQRTNIVNGADPKQLAAIATSAMSPEDLATIAVRHQQAQIHEDSAARLALAQKADEDARTNFQTYQAATKQASDATDQLIVQAMALSQQKIDPKEHGVGHFLASVLLGAVGGAASRATGGRNLALEQLDKNTQQRIDAQKADIANQWQGLSFKRNLIQEQLQQSGDMYKAAETYRVSTYDRAIAELQTKAQDYDPQGTTALRIADSVQQVQAQRATAVQAFNQQQFKDHLDAAKAANELAQQQETARHNKAQEGLDWSKFGLEKQKQQQAQQLAANDPSLVVHAPEDFAAMGLLKPPAPMSQADYNRWTAMMKAGGEASKATTEAQATQNAGTVYNPVTRQPLPTPSDPSKPIVLPPTEAGQIKDEIAATQNAIDSLSAVRRALQSDPSTFDRKEWARIQSDIAQSLPQLAKTYGEKYSARTEEALKDVTNLDYDSYRKRAMNKGTGIATIDNTIDTLVRNGNTTIGTKLGYDANKQPLFLDTSRPPESKPTSVDEAGKELSTRLSSKSLDEIADADLDYLAVQNPNSVPNGHARADEARNNPAIKQALDLGIPPSKIGELDKLAEQARAGNDQAFAAIQEQAERGETVQLRQYAQTVQLGVLSARLPVNEVAR